MQQTRPIKCTAFGQKYSPAVGDHRPSRMFLVSDLDAAHARIKGATPIVDDAGTRAFGFPDPDGHYLAMGARTQFLAVKVLP